MVQFENPRAAEALQALLTEEREAILAAKFEVLERLSTEKQHLSKILQKDGADQSVLSSLRNQIERNGLLLDAMREGIGSALDSVRALRDTRETLNTYDETGRRMTISSTRGKVVRRA